METKLKQIGILLFAAVILGCVSGCVAPGGVNSLKITRNDIDWAMVHYRNRADFGFLTVQEKDQVTAAYTAYQTAFDEAFKQANSNLDAPTPANVTQLADQLKVVLGSLP
jgi:hypothetical protein